MPKRSLLFLAATWIAAAIVFAQTGGPQNLRFESGEMGRVPPGWIVFAPGYTGRLTSEEVSAGKHAVELASSASGQPQAQTPFGNLMQSFDAAPYRGKQVRFRAAVRVEGETSQDRAQLWFRVDRQSGQVGFFDNMSDRPIQNRTWKYFEIVGNIESDAQRINIGIMLLRSGRAYIADASLDILGDAPKPVIEPARPLTSRGLRNETAFAKLFGYVRYFHPSDEAVQTDWDSFAIRGVREVESATDDTELAQKLLALFQPVSPTLRIVGSGQPYTRPAALVSGATSQWIRYSALQELLRGAPGVTANLEVAPAREPGKTLSVALQYEGSPMPEEQRPQKIGALEPGIYYVDIGRISDADFQTALPQLEKARGIVFDFRGYPSNIGPSFLTHLSDKAMTSPQWHVPLVLRPDRQDMQFERQGEWNLPPVAPFLAAKKAFIIDGRAISYAETCLGIIENYKLGAIVGAPTAGTNGNVNPFSLPGGYSIAWTGMKVLKHDGSRHHGIGILPTIPVSRTKGGVAAGRDEFLERALLAVKN